MHASSLLTFQDRQQQQLARHCYWDDVEQLLYIDARKLFPKEGVVTILGWDAMMMQAAEIPEYPRYFKIMNWSKQAQFGDWLKQIPKWVQDSCKLFPSHQMRLLHYAGKYPQILELLDHAPMLAWRLASADLQEPEIVALLSGKRSQIAESLGWPGKAETVRFLTNLRLRWVTPEIAAQIDACLFDEHRLTALQALPRINSMALSLAARFPNLIGSTLHKALAQLPCRPMQCQSMVALLEDAYAAAEYLLVSPKQLDRIGECRFLSDVTELYQQWIKQAEQKVLLSGEVKKTKVPSLNREPQVVVQLEQWLWLSLQQQHLWVVDWLAENVSEKPAELVAWQDDDGIWGALVHSCLAKTPEDEEKLEHRVLKVRGLENSLPGAKQLSTLHLWQAKQLRAD